MHFVKVICSIAPFVCGTASAPVVEHPTIPTQCQPYTQYVMGANNPSREMAQTAQESSCNQFAESAFAKGLRQFTESTGEWMSLTHCKHLGDYDPFNAKWSMECGLVYMALLESNNDYGDYCFNRKVAEAEYNGGAWVVWELGDVGNTSLDDAEVICGVKPLSNNRKRAAWACEENYQYIRNISGRQSRYLSLGGKYCE